MDTCASTCGAVEVYRAMPLYMLIFLQVVAEVWTRRPKLRMPSRRGASAALHSGGEEDEVRSSDSRRGEAHEEWMAPEHSMVAYLL